MEHNNMLIKQFVISNLQKGSKSFDQLLELCHSLYPDGLIDVLNDLIEDNVILKDKELYLLHNQEVNPWISIQECWQENLDKAYYLFSVIMDKIHLPHCLDYEWWFTHYSREKLASEIINKNPLPIPKTIVFLGSPMFGAFVSVLIPGIEVYILDKSKATIETIGNCLQNPKLHLIHYDAENPLPTSLIGIAQMVFFDPPWYVDYYNLFFRRGVQLAYNSYSVITTVLFPFLTRPESLQERRKVLEMAMAYELGLISMKTQIAHYLTPQFEVEALKRKNISAKNWRRGDLAVFISEGKYLPENITLRVEQFQWKEVLIGKIKVKLKVKEEESDQEYIVPEIIPLHNNEKLTFVSRRDPLRNKIDLWTSTHLGFRIKGWKMVWEILEGIQLELTIDQIAKSIKKSWTNIKIPDNIHKDIQPIWTYLNGIFNKE